MYFMCKRLSNHLNAMEKCHKGNLRHLESIISAEYVIFVKNSSEMWKECFVRHEQYIHDAERFKSQVITQFCNELKTVKQNLEECARANRIHLQGEQELRRAQLERIKANAALKTDQVNYGCRAMQAKCDENRNVICEKRRQLVNLETKLVSMREKLQSIDTHYQSQSKELKQSIERLQQRLIDTRRHGARKARIGNQKVGQCAKLFLFLLENANRFKLLSILSSTKTYGTCTRQKATAW